MELDEMQRQVRALADRMTLLDGLSRLYLGAEVRQDLKRCSPEISPPLPPITFTGPTSALDDRPQPFEERRQAVLQATAKGSSPPVRLLVTKANFYRLDELLRFGLDMVQAQASGPIEPLSLLPLQRLVESFWRHIHQLEGAARQSTVEFDFDDDEVWEMLHLVQTKAGQFPDAHLLRALGVVAGSAFVGPKWLLVDLTSRCNMRCLYCRSHSPWQAEDELAMRDIPDMDAELMERCIREAGAMGVEEVGLVGGGEPTLHPSFERLAQAIKKEGMRLNVSTNGLLLVPSLAQRLVEMRADSITVSVSAARADTYRLLRPGTPIRAFDRLRDNLLALSQAKRDGGQGPTLIMLHVINRLNREEILDMVRFTAEVGFDQVWFQFVHVEDFCRELALRPETVDATKAVLRQARELANELGLSFSDYVDTQASHVDGKGRLTPGVFRKRGCLVGWNFCFLMINHALSFCCGSKLVDFIEGERSFRDIWFSPEYDRYRRAARRLGEDPTVRFQFNTPLYDAFCDSCDNHNFNDDLVRSLEQTGLERFL